jgi:DMSO/TMAO reductase YedYZ heme-binding membrane subunit
MTNRTSAASRVRADTHHLGWRLLIAVIALAMVVVPPLVVGFSDTASVDPLWTALRVAALFAFTLIAANIILGAFMPRFRRLAKLRTLHRIHKITGLLGFFLAIAHGIMAFLYGIGPYETVPTWVGPVALALLAISLTTAFNRRRMVRSWRWIHRVNYVIFAVVFVHGLINGYDLQSDVFLRIVFGIYAAGVGAGLVYRGGSLIRSSQGEK